MKAPKFSENLPGPTFLQFFLEGWAKSDFFFIEIQDSWDSLSEICMEQMFNYVLLQGFSFFCAAKSHKKIAKITNHTKMEFSQSREKSRQSWQIMNEIPPKRRLFSLLLNFWRFGLYFNFISVPFWFGFMWCAFWSHVSFWFWFSTMSVLQIEKQWKFGRVGKNVAKRKSKLKLDIWP